MLQCLQWLAYAYLFCFCTVCISACCYRLSRFSQNWLFQAFGAPQAFSSTLQFLCGVRGITFALPLPLSACLSSCDFAFIVGDLVTRFVPYSGSRAGAVLLEQWVRDEPGQWQCWNNSTNNVPSTLSEL